MDRAWRDRVPWALLGALALVTVLGVGYAGFTSTAAFGPYTQTWEGTSDLRALADDDGRTLTVARNASAYPAEPRDGDVAFVLGPAERYPASEADRVRRFVENGGTLVVAAAQNGSANDLLSDVGATARVNGTPLRDETHHGPSPDFPVGNVVGNHSAVVGAETLMLNHGTAVEPGAAQVVVRASQFAYLDTDGDASLSVDEEPSAHPVLTAEPVGEGTVIVLADPSVFINVMLERADNRAILENVLAPAGEVVFDVSHVGDLPPFALALLAFRESILLQTVVGAVLIGGVWMGRRWLDDRTDQRDRRPFPGELSQGELRDVIARKRPAWEPERVDRMTEAIYDRWEHAGEEHPAREP